MTKVLLNDGEDITIQMSFDPNKNPYSITVIRRGNWIGLREFNKKNNDFKEAQK